jgi:hypothetical protein
MQVFPVLCASGASVTPPRCRIVTRRWRKRDSGRRDASVSESLYAVVRFTCPRQPSRATAVDVVLGMRGAMLTAVSVALLAYGAWRVLR